MISSEPTRRFLACLLVTLMLPTREVPAQLKGGPGRATKSAVAGSLAPVAGKCAPSGGVPRSVCDRLGETISVLDYGADNSGLTDCSAEVNLALAQGGLVFFPEGNYRVESPLMVTQSGTEVFGEGWGTVIEAAHDGTWGFAVAHPAQHVVIRDLELRGATSVEAANYHRAIAINTNGTGDDWSGLMHAAHATIRNVRFTGATPLTGWNTGVACNLADHLTVEGCQFENIIGTEAHYGYGITASSSYARVKHNRFLNDPALGQGRHAVYINGSASYATITGNVIRGFQRTAISIKMQTDEGRGHRVIGNSITASNVLPSTGSAVIHFGPHPEAGEFEGTACVVADNSIEDCDGHMIRFQGCTRSTIEGNVVTGMVSGGLAYGPPGQQPTAVTHDGIVVEGSHGTIIRGNTLGDLAAANQNQVGIEIVRSRDVLAQGNVVSGTTYRSAVRFNAATPDATTNCYALDNVVVGTAWNGDVDDPATGFVSNYYRDPTQ